MRLKHRVQLLLLLFIWLNRYQAVVSLAPAKQIIIEGLSDCHSNSTLSLKELKIVVARYAISFSGNFTINQKLPNILQLPIEVRRCSIKKNDCSIQAKETIKNICPLFSPKSIARDLLSMIHPSIKCPVNKGSYEIRNGRINIGSIIELPVENYRWIIKVRLLSGINSDRNKEFACIFVNGTVLPPASG